MEKLVWNWSRYGLTDEMIELFIEPYKKRKDPWWTSLPEVMFNHKSFANFYKKKVQAIFAPDTKENALFKRKYKNSNTPSSAKWCPGIFNDFLDKCYLIKAPCDIYVKIDFGKTANSTFRYYTEFANPKFGHIATHGRQQWVGDPAKCAISGSVNFKFCFPVIINSNSPLMFCPPQYHQKVIPFETMLGVLDIPYNILNRNFRNTGFQLNLNTLLQFPNDNPVKEIFIQAGTILSYMWCHNRLKMEKDENLLTYGRTRMCPMRKFFGTSEKEPKEESKEDPLDDSYSVNASTKS
jgi:hypothetical protein